ncbi:NERD domain-containing protein [Permianibacter aggregans]|uniref:Topoisomerase-like DNA binding C4 zinc finger protein n=1 Tax=Permianibacter aggregans TaxID=1510150 RepID=A0A4R6UKR0_9GAMM|nr:NERD domain-containing protein [Permianibacter aggregans]QGX39830.1 nuclease [Permianibacter aggregans]TDQ45923.1 topoisomerase-like DNA binding C4 zinc finger protein [Permianibacter aggregans]
MIVESVFTGLLSSAKYFLPVLVLTLIIRSAWFKGVIGEFVINVSAKLMLDRNVYHLMKDVTLTLEDGTTQIDHIIVSRFGVFVVETKNMRGWIFGDVNKKVWTQKIYRHTNTFQNPLHQNCKHLKALETLLGIDPSKLFSVVVFIGDSTFKTKMPENVTEGGGYIRYIKSKKEVVLSEAEVSDVTNRIQQLRLTPGIKTNLHHVASLNQRKAQTTTNCPRCGAETIVRQIKSGERAGRQFRGCINFPKCRGTLAI